LLAVVVGTVVTDSDEVIRVVRTADVDDEVEVEVDEASEEEVAGGVDEDSKISFWAPKTRHFEFFRLDKRLTRSPTVIAVVSWRAVPCICKDIVSVNF
jgi:hypothetical protein